MNDPEICTLSLHNQFKMSEPDDPVQSIAEVSDESEYSSQEDSSKEDSSEERRGIAWVPPKLAAVDMAYTIRDLMPFDDHRRNDKMIIDSVTTLRGSWPSPDEILNNVDLATCILLLVMRSVAPNIPLKAQWRSWDHLHAVAKQEILRKSLANAVRCKVFIRMRSLGLWYEGY
ncbi:hypothetical protein OBBRIDRAFT_827372 [Obba rivulosa]|uniref:PiggyBac transposable element-derived protein domain-containing protein n=1 Tax=Obba rivulosa TaxID=1052685 RepID=A0A8E2DIA2_9APHY|nr:hypothetical protein OBBRIDRAFT_827372 [Obba rivulosa]